MHNREFKVDPAKVLCPWTASTPLQSVVCSGVFRLLCITQVAAATHW